MAKTLIRTILVAIADPASSNQPALDRGAQLAKATGAHLVLFHAAFDSALSGRPFFDSKRLAKSRGWFVADRQRLLDRRASELRRSGLSVDACVVWEDPAHEAIVGAALREQADLVVVGRHERGADRSSQFRLADWEVMRLCPRPVLVAHPASNTDATGPVLAALDPTHTYDKPASLDASIVQYAAEVAAALQVECHAIHSIADGVHPPGYLTNADRKRVAQRMHSQLQRLIRRAHADVKAVHVTRGNVAESLTQFAGSLRAQILVMGIISRRWMKRFVIGDTAESIIRGLPCDLLLIKPSGFRLRLGRTRKEAIVLPRPAARSPARPRLLLRKELGNDAAQPAVRRVVVKA